MSLTAHRDSSNPFRFKEKKAIQAVAFLLKKRHPTKRDNYMRLLKLLYFADRESLEETGRPITNDRFVAMDRGPTLSHLLDLARQRTYDSSEWDKYIELDGFEIVLIQDPGNDKLCRYEVDKLSEIWERYRNNDEWDVAQISEGFEEWKKNYHKSTSTTIPLGDVLQAVGRADWLDAIMEDAQEEANFVQKFGEA
jgi:uncharacterized phage-associated protein